MSKKVMGDFGYHSIKAGAKGHQPHQMNGDSSMGFSFNDIVTIAKNLTSPQAVAQTPVSAPAPTVAKPVDNTMKYVKYGAYAIGGVVLLALVMKMLKKK